MFPHDFDPSIDDLSCRSFVHIISYFKILRWLMLMHEDFSPLNETIDWGRGKSDVLDKGFSSKWLLLCG